MTLQNILPIIIAIYGGLAYIAFKKKNKFLSFYKDLIKYLYYSYLILLVWWGSAIILYTKLNIESSENSRSREIYLDHVLPDIIYLIPLITIVYIYFLSFLTNDD